MQAVVNSCATSHQSVVSGGTPRLGDTAARLTAGCYRTILFPGLAMEQDKSLLLADGTNSETVAAVEATPSVADGVEAQAVRVGRPISAERTRPVVAAEANGVSPELIAKSLGLTLEQVAEL